jgi:hypothetical protein
VPYSLSSCGAVRFACRRLNFDPLAAGLKADPPAVVVGDYSSVVVVAAGVLPPNEPIPADTSALMPKWVSSSLVVSMRRNTNVPVWRGWGPG